MMIKQQSTPSALWALEGGEALQLGIGPGRRELHVTQGRLWLTHEGTAEAPADDVWLESGDSIVLDSGSQWVAEGWGETRFQLLVPPQACGRKAHSRGAAAAWRRALG
jgi:hypothetical protein